MGAHDEARNPCLSGTKALLAHAVAEEVPALGICLGLQLLAVACGGAVTLSASGPQLGLCAMQPTPAAASDPLLAWTGAGCYPAVHGNNDLVTEPPPGSTVLTTTAGTVQALRVGVAAWGVQFHPEVDPDTLGRWAAADVAGGALAADWADQRLIEPGCPAPRPGCGRSAAHLTLRRTAEPAPGEVGVRTGA